MDQPVSTTARDRSPGSNLFNPRWNILPQETEEGLLHDCLELDRGPATETFLPALGLAGQAA
jgi:hypothetical protein